MNQFPPNVLFNACVAGVAALLIGCTPNADPSNVAPVKTTPVAATGFQAAQASGKVQANVLAWAGNSTTSYTAVVKDVDACRNYGLEMGYMASGGVTPTKVSCTGENGQPIARFKCAAETASCTAVLKF